MSERRSDGRRESKGTLYVVATPIGNLEDITLRALKVLKSVQLVAAEDTRRTGILLRHFDIGVPIISVHEHNERARVEKIAARLARGESVAVVTDAGTPGVSDPGAALVAAIRTAGYRIEPIPGASAVAAAISAAGINTDGFTFLGFPPVRGKDRRNWFAAAIVATKDRAVVFFEAPHKLTKTLEELSELVEKPIFVARELTKLHEELLWATPKDLIEHFASPHGEFTLIIPPLQPSDLAIEPPADTEVADLVGHITKTEQTKSLRDAARLAGERLGMSARDVYAALERVKVGQ
jgi:16S rRNA (cytidine1402-2'-O)-methyltransferase